MATTGKINTHIRINGALHAALVAEAERHGISLNALIQSILTRWADARE